MPGEREPAVINESLDELLAVRLAIEALVADPTIFQRGGVLLRRLTRDGRGLLEPLPPQALRTVLTHWVRMIGKTKDGVGPKRLPQWLINGVFHAGVWPGIREVTSVSDVPVFSAAGEIVHSPGYHASSGIFISGVAGAGGGTGWNAAPSRSDAVAAADRLLNLVSDFPFVADSDKAAFLALLLTMTAQGVKGLAPLFLILSAVPGAGKTLLAMIAAVIATGHTVGVAPYPGSEREVACSVTSVVLSGRPVVLFDNIETRCFAGPTLNMALTTGRWDDRILGGSRRYEGALGVTFVATGNNVSLHRETARRVLPIRIEPLVERPEERQHFRIPRLLQYVRENQPELLRCVLTILRAFWVEGCPDRHLKPWGSYEIWSDLIRNAVCWLGLPDAVAPEVEAARALVSLLPSVLEVHGERLPGGRGKGAKASRLLELVESGSCSDELGEALRMLEPTCDAQKLGCVLDRFRGWVFDGRRLAKHRGSGGVMRWFVEEVQE